MHVFAVCQSLHTGLVAFVAHDDVRVCVIEPVWPVGHARVWVCGGSVEQMGAGAGVGVTVGVSTGVGIGTGIGPGFDDPLPPPPPPLLAIIGGVVGVAGVVGCGVTTEYVELPPSAAVACAMAVLAIFTAWSWSACGTLGPCASESSSRAVLRRVMIEAVDVIKDMTWRLSLCHLFSYRCNHL